MRNCNLDFLIEIIKNTPNSRVDSLYNYVIDLLKELKEYDFILNETSKYAFMYNLTTNDEYRDLFLTLAFDLLEKKYPEIYKELNQEV